MSTALLLPPVDILAPYIIAQGIGSLTAPADGSDWPLYTAHQPDDSSVKTNSACFYDTPGVKDGRLMAGSVISHYGMQLRIRCDTYVTGYAKAEEVALAMDDIFNAPIVIGANTYSIQNISRQSPVLPLGEEKGTKGRQLFVVNFRATITRVLS
jgi:hypothetical protein